jgi:hypothetical protein
MAGEADDAHAMPQKVGDAQRDIAATHEQQPLRHEQAD